MASAVLLSKMLRRNLPVIGLAAGCFLLLLSSSANREEDNELEAPTGNNVESDVVILPVDEAASSGRQEGCDSRTVITSAKLDTRYPWTDDDRCARHRVSHMIPHCRPPIALASYPGSGNTWLRYLLEGAGGIFTGSRYKDLQIQMFGLWGEIRNWEDGSTIVQKTHDAGEDHVKIDFGGRGVLLLRDPYAAILSNHNYLYSGHHGTAPADNYKRKDWPEFVAIQAKKWLDMLARWTAGDESKDKVLVIHYEELKSDLSATLRRLLAFLDLPVDEERLECVERHRNGFFKRGGGGDGGSGNKAHQSAKLPFDASVREQMDAFIDYASGLLVAGGHRPLPVDKYDFYRKSDEEVLAAMRRKSKAKTAVNEKKENDLSKPEVDTHHGTKMVLMHYLKWLDNDQKGTDENGGDMKTTMLKHLFRTFKANSNANTLTGLSERAEGLLTKAVEIWPVLSKPFQKDPIREVIETEGRGGTIKQIRDVFPWKRE